MNRSLAIIYKGLQEKGSEKHRKTEATWKRHEDTPKFQDTLFRSAPSPPPSQVLRHGSAPPAAAACRRAPPAPAPAARSFRTSNPFGFTLRSVPSVQPTERGCTASELRELRHFSSQGVDGSRGARLKKSEKGQWQCNAQLWIALVIQPKKNT